jgi:hypothetical protein
MNDCALADVSIERANIQLAVCAVHLATGNAVLCRAIKAGTIETHLRNITKFCGRANPRNPRKSDQTAEPVCKQMQSVVKEVKRWEDIPNQREPFTIEMLTDVIQQQHDNNPSLHGRDSLLSAMTDWASAGLLDGFRLSEWAQPNGHHALNNPHQNLRSEACAFCLGDVRFLTDDKVNGPIDRVLLELAPTTPLVGRDFFKHRTQKNGKNGEERQHTRNT